MSSPILFWRVCLIGIFALLPVIGSSYAETVDSDVVVITSPSIGEHTIARSTLRAMFGMRLSKWSDGTPVRVFVMKDDSVEHASFSKNILQVFPHQLRLSWDRQVFSGQGQYPEQVASMQDMISRIASTPGAVGYVKANEVTNNVRILQIR